MLDFASMRKHPVLATVGIIGSWYIVLIAIAALANGGAAGDESNFAAGQDSGEWIKDHPALWISVVILCLASIVTLYFWSRRTTS
jgi:hypothetical protein